jgi:hypothetical protein
MKRYVNTAAAIAFVITIAMAVGNAQEPQKVLTDPEFKTLLQKLHPQEIDSFRGIKAMSVVIDQLDPDLVAAGFKGVEVRNSAEVTLRGVGIKNLSPEELNKAAGAPFLKVKIDIEHETIRDKPYTGVVKVALTQFVTPYRVMTNWVKINPSDTKDTKWKTEVDAKNIIFAETWHTQRCFKANDMKGIQDAALALVAEFAHEYERATK